MDRRRAVALRYGQGDGVPRVVAQGEDWLAERIVAKAEAAGVPVAQSRELVGMLLRLELDDAIPPALYRVVAEILVWAWHLEAEGVSRPVEGRTWEPLVNDASRGAGEPSGV